MTLEGEEPVTTRVHGATVKSRLPWANAPRTKAQLVAAPDEECHESGRKVRADALPEHTDYADVGCTLAPSCLACPFEACRYERDGEGPIFRTEQRAKEAAALRAHGLVVKEIAVSMGLAQRSVRRYLALSREAAA